LNHNTQHSETKPLEEETKAMSSRSDDAQVVVTVADPHAEVEVECPILQAKLPYVPKLAEELTLEVGDEIALLIAQEGEWWKGKHMETNKYGWFPIECVVNTKTVIKLKVPVKETEAPIAEDEEHSSMGNEDVEPSDAKVSSKVRDLQKQLFQEKGFLAAEEEKADVIA
jgi:hypothetical protein